MLGAEASMVFVGNTQHTLPYMLKHTDLFDDLPDKYHDSAFLDRIHFYIPGWEVDIIRGEMFSSGYGFVIDYLAEILRTFRNHDFSHLYNDQFTLNKDISTRDQDGINKTFSGLMKILFPHGEATQGEIEEILNFAVEGRKRIKDQLMRIDPTYAEVDFGYTVKNSKKAISVSTLEERQYPKHYWQKKATENSAEENLPDFPDIPSVEITPTAATSTATEPELKEQHLTFQENQRGASFDKLFGPYLKNAGKIVITDPYIRLFFQARNLMELLETIIKHKSDDAEVEVQLITVKDEFKEIQQVEYFEKMAASCIAAGVVFSWTFDEDSTIHARHIVIDNGWKILLDRGLDIFQRYEMNDAFSISNLMQQFRPCKAFEVTFINQGLKVSLLPDP